MTDSSPFLDADSYNYIQVSSSKTPHEGDNISYCRILPHYLFHEHNTRTVMQTSISSLTPPMPYYRQINVLKSHPEDLAVDLVVQEGNLSILVVTLHTVEFKVK